MSNRTFKTTEKMIKPRYSACNLPCEYKRNFESSSKEQLLRCTTTTGRQRNGSPWQQLAWATRVKRGTALKGHRCGQIRRHLSMSDVFDKLSTKTMFDDHLKKDLGGWPHCSNIHVDQYYSPFDKNMPVVIKRPHTSASSTRPSFEEMPVKQRSSSSQDRRLGSGKEEWQEPLPLTPISYDFKHFKHSRQYADQYREEYTYIKMKVKKGKIECLSGTSLPKARLVCLNSVQGVRALTLLGKSALPAGGKSQETAKSDFEGKWRRYKDTSTEICPIPEIRFIKIPLARRSTPSIPSNANGRFAPRLTGEDEIPCTLDISSATNTVVNPVAGKVRTITLLCH